MEKLLTVSLNGLDLTTGGVYLSSLLRPIQCQRHNRNQTWYFDIIVSWKVLPIMQKTSFTSRKENLLLNLFKKSPFIIFCSFRLMLWQHEIFINLILDDVLSILKQFGDLLVPLFLSLLTPTRNC